MHRARGKTQNKLSVMERRIPQNPKFKNVKSKLNTGTTVDKVRLISHKEYLKRRDETFYRLLPRNLKDMFSEYEDSGSFVPSGPEMVAKMVRSDDGAYTLERVPESNNMHDDLATTGGPRIVTHDEDDDVAHNYPYLILDVRSAEEFNQNRIHRAKSFPSAHVNRDRLHPDLYHYKNKDSTLIILYENEERLAIQTAKALSEKGFDNLYVLQGGMLDFCEQEPHFVEGQRPVSKRPRNAARSSQRDGCRDAYKVPSALSSRASVTHSKTRTSRRKSSEVDSNVDSILSHLSVADSVITQSHRRKHQTQILR